MRRRPGIQGLQLNQAARGQYRALGDAVNATRAEAMKAQMAAFRSALEEFALAHRSAIRADPAFRARFHAMCANIGVDPLSSNKGAWNRLLGFGDFYYELAVQAAEACLASRPFNGGLVELRTLHRHVSRRRGSAAAPVSEDDLLRAIKALRALGGGFSVVDVGGRSYVASVPEELSTEANEVLRVAEALGGYMTAADLRAACGWGEERALGALGAAARRGLVWVDDPPEGGARIYWVPAVGMEAAIGRYQAALAAAAGQAVAAQQPQRPA